jgi:hypothetical protein
MKMKRIAVAFCVLALVAFTTLGLRATVTHEPPPTPLPGSAQPEPSATPSDPDANEEDDDIVSDEEDSEDSEIDDEMTGNEGASRP